MPSFLFPNGAATEAGAYIVVQVLRDDGTQIDGNLFADYRGNPEPEGFGTDWGAISLCYRPAEEAVHALGESGVVLRIAESGATEESIAPEKNGPAEQGALRELRLVGDVVYATGMGRQLYWRKDGGTWERADAGLLDSSDRATVVVDLGGWRRSRLSGGGRLRRRDLGIRRCLAANRKPDQCPAHTGRLA